MQKGNLVILVICQLISATGAIVMVTLGGIIGSTLTENLAFATLPISMTVVTVAAVTVPATMLMRRIGRSRGFAIASLSAAVALGVAIVALTYSSFSLYVVASMLFGINMAFTQQYRYAAAESVEPRFTGRAISFVLLGAIGGALVGPQLIARGEFWVADVPYAGTFYALSAMFVFQSLLFLLLGPLHADDDVAARSPPRPLRDIVSQPLFMVSVLAGAVAYGTMSFIMTATPLSMHDNDGFTMQQTSHVISMHVLGMYTPSLVSGYLLDRFGVTKVMKAGAVALFAALVVGAIDHSYMHYWVALVLLGVGWNFLYVGATTSLTFTYRNAERFKAQAVNEFAVFGMSALGSLLSGTVLYLYGWKTLVLAPLPVLLLTLLALYMIRNNFLLVRPAVGRR